MSSDNNVTEIRRGTTPKRKPGRPRKNPEALATEPIGEPIDSAFDECLNDLDTKERQSLQFLGWTRDDINLMTTDEAFRLIAEKGAKPGSRAYIRQHGSHLPDSQTNEGIAEASEGKKFQEAYVIADEFTHELVRGDSQFDAIVNEYVAANPGKRFRWMNPKIPPRAGVAWKPVFKNGEQVVVGGLYLHWMPEDLYDKVYRQPNLRASARMQDKVEAEEALNEREAQNRYGPGRIAQQDARLAPVTGARRGMQPGLTVEMNPNLL